MAARRERMTRLDAHHAGLRVDYLYGELEVPTREAFVEALVRIAATSALPRVGAQIAPDGRSRLRDADALHAWADRLVTTIPGDGHDDFVATYVSRATAEPTPDAMRFTLSPRHVLFSGDHSLGDSAILMRMAPAVLAVAAGHPLPEWLTHREPRAALAHALWRTFALHPRQLAALRTREGAAGDGGARPAPDAGTRPWHPDPRLATITIPAERFTELRRAYTTPFRKVSAAGALLGLVRAALEAEGVALSDVSWIPVDARRYLPPTAQMVGNLAPQVRIRTPPLASAPDFSDQLAEALASGRPLVALALSAVRTPHAGDIPTTAPLHPRAEVTVTMLPRREEIDSLGWRDPATGWMHASTAPGTEPEALRVVIGPTAAGATISAAFHGSVFDPAVVQRALERLRDAELAPLMQLHALPARP